MGRDKGCRAEGPVRNSEKQRHQQDSQRQTRVGEEGTYRSSF